MALVDFILNIAALLLWLTWRARQFDPLVRKVPATLVTTLKRAEPRNGSRWAPLLFLMVLLLTRALLYWEIGSPAQWTPKLELGVVVLAFRSETFVTVLLFSALSFLRVLAILYFWLLVLVAIQPQAQAAGPVPRLIQLHLGWFARWPWPAQILLLPVLAAMAWLALHPVLLSLGLVNYVRSTLHLAIQGTLVASGLFFTLKYLVPPFLVLHLIASYVFLGNSPVWDFVSATARQMLAPLGWLRVAKVDFAPVVGVLLVLALLHWLPNSALVYLAQKNLSLWPQ